MEANHPAFRQVLTPTGRIRAVLLGILLLFAVSLTVAAAWAGIGLVGKPFQGFLMQRAGYLAPYQRAEWTGLKAGMLAEDVVVAVDGKTVEWAGTVYDRIRSARTGDVVRYDVVRGGGTARGKRMAFDVPVSTYEWADLARDFVGIAVVGWLYLVVGVAAAWLRPKVRAARGVWFLGLAAGTFCITYFDANSTFTVAFFCVISIAAIGAAFMYLALIFPQEIGLVRRFPWIAWVPFALAAVFGAANWIGYMTPGLAATEPATFQLAYGMIRYATVWLFLGLLTYLALLPVHFAKAGRGTVERHQAAVCVAGALLSFAPVGALYGVPFIFERAPLLTLDWVLLGVAMFPLSIAYAIVRHRLFDIDVVVRRSVLYTVLTMILTAVYVGASTALQQGILLGLDLESREAGLVATALVVGLFGPLRALVRDALDRRFFRRAYDAQRIVEEVSCSLVAMLDVGAITRRILEATQVALNPTSGAVFLYDRATDAYRPAASLTGARYPEFPAGAGFLRYLERGEILSRRPLPVKKPIVVSAGLDLAGADLVIPLGSGRVTGFVALGPKLNEKPYSDVDLGLLVTLANQGAIAIANCLRFEELTRTRDSLARADKLAALGNLASGVAHELNTPLGVLRGQMQLIGDRASQEDLDRMRRQVSKMERIIQDLLAFGRPKPVELHEIDARELADRVVEFLRLADPRFRRADIANLVPADLPRLWGDTSRLEQVLLNLVTNAVHATAEEEEPAVSICGEALGDEIHLAVEDNGCGIAQCDLGRVFDPFFTTKQAGEGTGLGLSVSFGIIQEHGGTIEVRSKEGEGTRMTIRLPRTGNTALVRSPV